MPLRMHADGERAAAVQQHEMRRAVDEGGTRVDQRHAQLELHLALVATVRQTLLLLLLSLRCDAAAEGRGGDVHGRVCCRQMLPLSSFALLICLPAIDGVHRRLDGRRLLLLVLLPLSLPCAAARRRRPLPPAP